MNPRWQAYRDAATKKVRDADVPTLQIQVPNTGTVWPVEGGAFVECTIWVTTEEMETEKDQGDPVP